MKIEMSAMKVMLAKEYEKGMKGAKKDTTDFAKPPLSWYMSEKFDGYRATFHYNEDGKPVFLSRAGKPFNAPQWFLDTMPHIKLLKDKCLDGELWAGRENFQMMGTVRKKKPVPEDWVDIQYVVYDITNMDVGFVDRLKELRRIVRIVKEKWHIIKKNQDPPYRNIDCPLVFTEQKKITSMKQMEEYYKKIINAGAEGIMIKHPQCQYESGRSSNLLKYKPSFDREAMIVDYKPGKGKYTGKLGGFVCKPLINHDTYMTIDNDPNHEFTLSGMDDKIRENYKKTHEVGTIITYECSGFTDRGVPRFGRYMRKRTDVVLKESVDSSVKLDQIISIFEQIENNLRINKDHFRAKAYSKVLPSLKKLNKDSDLTEENFDKIKGLGKGLREKIRLVIETGTCPDYEYIQKNKDKIDLKDLFQQIHGIGPGCAEKLVNLGFKSVEDLHKCKDIQSHLNDVQMKGLAYYEETIKRIPYKEIELHEEYLKDKIKEIDPEAEITIAGSYRRKNPDSGDIDILLKAKNPSVYESFIEELSKSGYLRETLAHGPKKFMGISNIGSFSGCTNRRIDIMYTKPEEYPFAVLYFTGSMEFNVKMRNQLLERGYTLNEYGVKFTDKTKKFTDKFKTEKDIFDYFGYQYVEPCNR